MDEGTGDAFAAVFFAVWFVFFFGGFAVWIWALVDLTRTPDHAFRLTGREKTNWIVVVVLGQIVGGLIWRFGGARKEVRAAAAANPYGPPVFGPPAGWYPDPSGAPGMVWWSGSAWTGHRQDFPSPPPTPPPVS